MGFPGGASGKEPTCLDRRCKRHGLMPGLGRSPGGRCSNLSSISAWRISWREEPGELQSNESLLDKTKATSNYRTIALISHTSKVMLEILQARLQQYMNCELPEIQAGFRKGRETRDQIANICWIIGKAREFQKNIYFCSLTTSKTLIVLSKQTVENSSRNRNTRPPFLTPKKSVCRSRSNS